MSSFHTTRNINLFILIILMLCTLTWQAQTTYAAGGGTASFTDGGYARDTTIYFYDVVNGPPNTCGTLQLIRNGVAQSGANWICTDSNGNARKGPWGPPTSNETVQSSRIVWPDGTSTTGGEFHINDVSRPNISSNQSGGPGPMPTAFSGTASDAQWGTGFKFGSGGWSYLYATFFKTTTPQGTVPDKYWDGTGYNSTTEVRFNANVTPPGGGYTITWSVSPPTTHTATDSYGWCVYTKDLFYPAFSCTYFRGPH